MLTEYVPILILSLLAAGFAAVNIGLPIVGVQKVSDDDEAVKLMNDSPYGLTAAIWTRDQERAFRIGAQIETGTFFMNRCDYLDPLLPWTGVKDTGKGMSLSKYGFLPLTRRKSFHLRTQT